MFLLLNEASHTILFIGLGIHILLLFFNAIPGKSSNFPNDITNTIEALKSSKAAYGLYAMLYVEDEMMRGKRYKDFDEKLFATKKDDDFENYFIAYLVMLEAYRLKDLKLHNEAFNKLASLNTEKLPPAYKGFALGNLTKATKLIKHAKKEIKKHPSKGVKIIENEIINNLEAKINALDR